MVVKQEKYVSDNNSYSGKSLTWPACNMIKLQAKKDNREISMMEMRETHEHSKQCEEIMVDEENT